MARLLILVLVARFTYRRYLEMPSHAPDQLPIESMMLIICGVALGMLLESLLTSIGQIGEKSVEQPEKPRHLSWD